MFLVVASAPLTAQTPIYESVGIRAQGMGGAFVAVADDATATWWNPAGLGAWNSSGLAGGTYLNALVEYSTLQDPRSARDVSGGAAPAWRTGAGAVAASFPALGLSYYRLRVSEIQPIGATADGAPGRLDQGHASVRLGTLVVQEFGATVGQSVGDHLVVASTLKLVHGAFATAPGVAGEASLDRASELKGSGHTLGDLDVGAIAAFGGVRFGVAVKNLTEPGFVSGTDRVDLQRQVRVGVAAMTERVRSTGGVTLALDADLTRTATAAGDARHVAVGVEVWSPGRRVGVRAGASASTVGDARPVAGGGVSVAVRPGLYLDGMAMAGADQSRKGWGVALRVTF